MPKRKREDVARIQDEGLRVAVSRLKATFENGVQQLAAQLKLARVFDRQKMSRRTKQAGGDKAKLDRLNAEIEVLKGLVEAKVARNYLLKQCVRTKRINESEAFQALFRDAEVKPPASTAESNVLGRLFKSGPVNEVLPGIMKGVRELVGADGPKEVQQSTAVNGAVKVDKLPKSRMNADEDIFEGFSDDVVHDNMNGDDSTSENDMAGYDARLADSDDESSENDEDLDPMQITDDEASVQDEAELSLSDFEHPPPKPVKKATSTIDSKAFLPSLMHGGYFSGSDDDDDRDGYNPDKAYTEAQKPRKNRRGQQERRAIAEKKFGAKAKHLVKARGAEGVHGDRQKFISGDRSAGWDMKRGAVEKSKGRGASGANRGPVQNNRFDRRKEAKSDTGVVAKSGPSKSSNAKKDGGKLHPSWEAAKLKKSQSMAPEAFTGKKITFD